METGRIFGGDELDDANANNTLSIEPVVLLRKKVATFIRMVYPLSSLVDHKYFQIIGESHILCTPCEEDSAPKPVKPE